jgi:general secretion pathway protein A
MLRGNMYDRYFNFKERPFRLLPDPAYLFLARSHQEAMAHLAYAVRAGDGFVAVTGEVGTGKTTLCRSFLEELEKDVATAFIFNPPADPVDLIRAVNRDLGLPAESDDRQAMIHELNTFLIQKKSRGQQVVLVIDEAQTLNRHVLEQIRLLSNLETARSKLLQIILVGQPELAETLKSRDLRQLRQRITLSCRLRPLSPAETAAYIRHRLRVASSSEPVRFSPSAVRRIYRFSAGIPRLINIACDRALLVAFTRDRRTVGARTAGHAVDELRDTPAGHRARKMVAAALAVALVSTAAALSLNAIGKRDRAAPPPAKTGMPARDRDPAPAAPATAALPAESALPEKTVEPLRGPGKNRVPPLPACTRSRALETVFSRWGHRQTAPADVSPHQSDLAYLKKAARGAGFSVYAVTDRPALVEKLNLPAILSLAPTAGATAGHLVLTGVTGTGFLLAGPDAETDRPAARSEVAARWSGTAHILWRDFYGITGEIPAETTREAILSLKRLLRESGHPQLPPGDAFDAATRQAVVDFQASQGLPVDGVVGSLTKIALYNAQPDLDIPRLSPPSTVEHSGGAS